MFKKILVLGLCIIIAVSLVSCSEKKSEVAHGTSSEVNIGELPIKNLISGYAFEAGTDEDGTLEAYVFFSDSKLYYFGKSTKIGSWSISGDKVAAHYTSSDGVACNETVELTISLESEIGITINGVEFMMIDTADSYIS